MKPKELACSTCLSYITMGCGQVGCAVKFLCASYRAFKSVKLLSYLLQERSAVHALKSYVSAAHLSCNPQGDWELQAENVAFLQEQCAVPEFQPPATHPTNQLWT